MKSNLFSGGDQVRLYTMRELNQDTAGTIEQINNSGKPGVITRHGRFVAVIYPLADVPLEGRVIARALEDVEIQNQITGASTVSGISTALELIAKLNAEEAAANACRACREAANDIFDPAVRRVQAGSRPVAHAARERSPVRACTPLTLPTSWEPNETRWRHER